MYAEVLAFHKKSAYCLSEKEGNGGKKVNELKCSGLKRKEMRGPMLGKRPWSLERFGGDWRHSKQ